MRLIEQIFKILAPSDCLGCGQEGSLICNWCIDDTLPVHESRCYRCNRLTSYFAVCETCRRKTSLRHVYVRAEYTDVPKELVHRMKFSYSREAGEIIASQLLDTIPALLPKTLIVHVPAVTNHMRERGFDHARLMAGALARLSGHEHMSALHRTNQHRQVGSDRRTRLIQQEDAFRVAYDNLLQGRHVLLVDDVVTTGATLESAAKVLKAAGVKTVDAVVFARSVL